MNGHSAAQTIDPAQSDITKYCHLTAERFATVNDALHGIARKRRAIRCTAEKMRRAGRIYRDQDHPVEIIHLAPPAPTRAPLLMIGGMGPLAGLTGFEMACRQFGGQREILLFQACDTPCRTRAITAALSPMSRQTGHRVITSITHALIKGAMMVTETVAETVLLCNTAHHYLPAAQKLFQASAIGRARRFNVHSLITTAADRARRFGHRCVLVMATEGTHVAKLYSKALDDYRITSVGIPPRAQEWLGCAIRDGIKGQDIELAHHAGRAFFQTLEQDLGEIDGVIAGCTEVPLILKLLTSAAAKDDLTAFLHRTDIVDPLATLFRGLR